MNKTYYNLLAYINYKLQSREAEEQFCLLVGTSKERLDDVRFEVNLLYSLLKNIEEDFE